MRKTWLWLLLPAGVGLLYVGSAAATGQLIRDKLAEQSAFAQRALPKGTLQEHVERGLWTTTRTWTLRVGCAPAAEGAEARAPLAFRWRDVIQHGPLPGLSGVGFARIDSRLELPEAIAAHVQTESGAKLALTAHTRVGFGGELDSHIVAPAAEVKSGADALKVSGLDARVTGQIPLRAGKVDYKATLAPVNLQVSGAEASSQVTVGRFTLNGQLQFDPQQSGLFMPMHADGHVTHMLIRVSGATASGAPGEVALGLNDVSFKHAIEREGELWNMRGSTRGALDVLGFKVDKLDMAVALRRVHEPSYTKLARELLALSSRCEAQPSDPSALLAQLHGDVVTLLSHDLEYAVGPFVIDIGGKRAELSYRLGTLGVAPEDRALELPALLMRKGVAHAEASVDLALIELVAKRIAADPSLQSASPQPAAAHPGDPQPTAAGMSEEAKRALGAELMAQLMIARFVTEGYITHHGESVKAQLDFAGGKFALNGKPFELPDFGDEEESQP